MERAYQEWNLSKADNFEVIDTEIYTFVAEKNAEGQALEAYFAYKSSKLYMYR